MTLNEQIMKLQTYKMFEDEDTVYVKRDDVLKLLEQEPCEDWYDVPSDEMTLGQARQAVKDLRKMWAEHLEKEPCGKDINVPATDAISRQAVLNILDDMVKDYIKENDFDKAQGVAWVKVQKLPPVNPQPKTGHWNRVTDKAGHLVWECDCGWQQRFATNFCPDCGTKMEEQK